MPRPEAIMSKSPANLKQILTILDSIAPFALAEAWDNVGLMVGSHDQIVEGILVGLDPTQPLLDEAQNLGANLIVTHHPAIFKPLTSIRTDQPLGAFLARAIQAGIAVVSSHTNLDVVAEGVSYILARKLGLTALSPLTGNVGPEKPGPGFGQVGSLKPPLPAETFLRHLCTSLRVPALKHAGPLPATIERVAVCGGSGSDLTELAHAQGADIYLTGEVKHSTARWAEAAGFCIVDAGHFATENLLTESLAAQLAREFASRDLDIAVHATTEQQNPFTFFRWREEGETN